MSRALLLALCALCATTALALSGESMDIPAALTDDTVVTSLLEEEAAAASVGGLPFHFDVPLGQESEEEGEMEFLVESSGVSAAVTPEVAARAAGVNEQAEKGPVLCETVCRPLENATVERAAETPEGRAAVARARAKSAAAEAKVAEAEVSAAEGTDTNDLDLGASASDMPDPDTLAPVLLEMKRTICEGKGGAWQAGSASCEPFMRASSAKTAYDPDAIFSHCAAEFGTQYVPCSPYQALALAHLYEVPDHNYFWLWPGGRADQVRSAATKQEIGHNPVAGLDRCPPNKHVGFFHNWDEAHVDSWGCLQDKSALPVLCCRRR